MPLRILPYSILYQTAITYEFWDTRYLYLRKDYGLLDWLSDLGGLLDLFKLVAATIIGFFVVNAPSVFTATELTASQRNI